MSKYRPKNYWNYRVVTKLYVNNGIDIGDGSINKLPDERLFSIVEVYYKDGKPNSYAESKNILRDLESKSSLKWTHKKIKKAFKRAILDLDNWPKKYIPSEHINTTNDLYS